jgi:hypothetical protein
MKSKSSNIFIIKNIKSPLTSRVTNELRGSSENIISSSITATSAVTTNTVTIGYSNYYKLLIIKDTFIEIPFDTTIGNSNGSVTAIYLIIQFAYGSPDNFGKVTAMINRDIDKYAIDIELAQINFGTAGIIIYYGSYQGTKPIPLKNIKVELINLNNRNDFSASFYAVQLNNATYSQKIISNNIPTYNKIIFNKVKDGYLTVNILDSISKLAFIIVSIVHKKEDTSGYIFVYTPNNLARNIPLGDIYPIINSKIIESNPYNISYDITGYSDILDTDRTCIAAIILN